jgi:hypothetical protein
VPLYEALRLALQTVWSHRLRSFFTLLGIIVSVAFFVAVVAVIQGMNAYVRDRLAGAIVGVNAFQIRRDPIQVGFIDDEEWKQIQRRPIIAPEDVAFILTHEKVLPGEGAVRPEGDRWQSHYTPELHDYVRTHERLIFRLFPEFDVHD